MTLLKVPINYTKTIVKGEGSMYGKTIMSWNVPQIHSGTPMLFATEVLNGKYNGVCLKVGNGSYVHTMPSYSPWPTWGENIRQELIDELRRSNIKIYFWHFLYGYDPVGELNIAVAQARRFKPDGYIWDAEGAFDGRFNAEANARLITKGFKEACPDIPQALCWWALPRSPITGSEWHPIKVARAFLETVDVVMPMMYWQGEGAPAAIEYLYKSLAIWRDITQKPITPVGRTYIGDGGVATPEGIKAFAESVLKSANSMNLVGNSWWCFDTAIKNYSWMQALKETPEFDIPFELPTEVILRRLVEAHPGLFPELVD